jgi:hypothetical protein
MVPSGEITLVNIHSLAIIAAAMSDKPTSRSLVSEEKVAIAYPR